MSALMNRLPGAVLFNCIFPLLSGSDVLQLAYTSRLHLEYVHKNGYTPYRRFIRRLNELGLRDLPRLLVEHRAHILSLFVWNEFDRVAYDPSGHYQLTIGSRDAESERALRDSLFPHMRFHNRFSPYHGTGTHSNVSISLVATGPPPAAGYWDSFDGRTLILYNVVPPIEKPDKTLKYYWSLLCVLFMCIVILMHAAMI